MRFSTSPPPPSERPPERSGPNPDRLGVPGRPRWLQRLGQKAGAWLPLKNRVFGFVWVLSMASGSSVVAQDVATRWLVHRASPSPFLLSLVPILSSAAFFVLTFPGGVLADRLPRTRLLSVVYLGLWLV